MAIRKPLVVISGQVQELPAGDVLTPWPMVKAAIDVGEVCTITAGYQLLVVQAFINSGVVINSGRLVVL